MLSLFKLEEAFAGDRGGGDDVEVYGTAEETRSDVELAGAAVPTVSASIVIPN